MAIRKRHGREGLAYQVYWNNPYTGARESKTFHTLADARRFDSLIRHRLQHEVESFMPEQLVREGADRTVEDAIFLYLRDKRFPDKDAKKFLTSMRLPLMRCGHIRLCDLTTEKWNELEKVLLRTPKIRGEGLLSSAFVHGILTNLRSVLRWAHDRSMMESLPKMHVPHPNYRKTVPPSKEEENGFMQLPLRICSVLSFLGCCLDCGWATLSYWPSHGRMSTLSVGLSALIRVGKIPAHRGVRFRSTLD